MGHKALADALRRHVRSCSRRVDAALGEKKKLTRHVGGPGRGADG